MESLLIQQKVTEEYWLKKLIRGNSPSHYASPSFYVEIQEQIRKGDPVCELVQRVSKGKPWGEFTVFLVAYGLTIQKVLNQENPLIASTLPLQESEEDVKLTFLKLKTSVSDTLKKVLVGTQAEVKDTMKNDGADLSQLESKFEGRKIKKDQILNFGLDYDQLNPSQHTKDVSMLLTLKKVSIGFEISFKGSERLYDASFATGFLQTFKGILAQAADNLDSEIDHLTWNPKLDTASLSCLKGNELTFDEGDHVVRRFQQQVLKSPERTAVTYGKTTISYQDFNRKANLLARYILEEMLAEEPIAVMVDRSVEMIISIMGVLKAGGAYIPIDPNYPSERMLHILKQSKTKLLITHSDYLTKITGFEETVFAADIQFEFIDFPDTNPGVVISHDDLAYVLFTSGSTGQPKGAMIPHGAVLNLVEGLQNKIYEPLGEGLNIALMAPVVFDPSVQQICFALCFGHSLNIVPDELKSSGDRIWNFLAANQIHVTDGTPLHLSLMLNANPVTPPNSLKQLLIGGDVLPVGTLRNFYQQLRQFNCDAVVTNLYGPTECCVDVTYYTVTDKELDHIDQIPIGKPLPNREVAVLDEIGRPVPVGVIGEIYISGKGVGQGYLNDEKLSKENFFINHPIFNNQNTYRTGDFGRVLLSGLLQFKGRKDGQVKVRGYRIELGELENRLISFPSVREAAILVTGDKVEDRSLVAYVAGDDSITSKDLRENLLDKLPKYMVPDQIFMIPKLPYTSNGKIDRQQLEGMSMETDTVQNFIEPAQGMEQKIAQLWKEVLEVEAVGALDDFFDIGGHSLKAAKVISRIQQELKSKIEFIDIFNYPVLKDFAVAVSSAEEEAYFNIQPLSEQAWYDVSHAQRRLWILDQMEEGSGAYNIVKAFTIEGPIILQVFQEAFSTVVSRHESLRTTFTVVDGEPKQVVHSEFDSQIRILSESHSRTLEETINKLSHVQFDLLNGPLVQGSLVKTKNEHFVFVLAIHHIIADGWSFEVLVNDFMKSYQDHLEKMSSSLPSLEVHYKDYTAWHESQLSGERLEQLQAYWGGKFSGELPVLDLPLTHKRPSVKTYNGRHHVFIIDESKLVAMKKMGSQKGVSLFMLLLATVNTLLHKYTGQRDIILGIPVAGRDHAQLEKIIGFFVNTLPFRTRFQGTDTFDELLGLIKQNIVNDMDHQAYPFDRLIDDLNLERYQNRSPLFDVMVALQNTDYDEINYGMLGETVVREVQVEQVISKYDITFNFKEIPEGLLATFEYNTDLFSADFVERMEVHFLNLLTGILEDSEQPLSQLQVIDSKEQNRLLVDLNPPEIKEASGTTIVQQIEEHATKIPDHVAIYDEQKITYKQLNYTANNIANYLIQTFELPTEMPVGVLMPRSHQFVTGSLGIMKAGAAYVPLDPTLPDERIKQIIADTELSILLTVAVLLDRAKNLNVPQVISIETEFSNQGESPLDIVPTQLAYIIFTSGSTGKPKGVMVEHHSLSNLCNWHKDQYKISQKSRASLVASVGFDALVWEIWPYIAAGATIYPFHEDSKSRSSLFIELVNQHQITHSFLPTPLYELWHRDLHEQVRYPMDLLVGGDQLSVASSGRLRVHNNYGPTEGTVVATTYNLSDCTTAEIPIGQPISGTYALILDEYLNLKPFGAVGELYIGGEGIARGYFKSTDINKHAFIKSPFRPGDTLYKTGDQCKWLDNGQLVFRGRKDDQVKIRGNRIELEEVTLCLLQVPEVKHAVALVKNVGMTNVLVAYYTGTASKEAIKEHLRNHLPVYMVPDLFEVIESFPITSNGKIDKATLPIPYTNTNQDYVSPKTELEKILVGIWKEVLDSPNIGIEHDFFELGGHSLNATKIIGILAKSHQINLSIRKLFDYPTISELARIITQDKSSQEVNTPIPRISRNTRTFPLSHAQKRLWILSQFQNSNLAYNVPVIYRINGPLSKVSLEQSLIALINRHEILRTVFKTIDGEPVQQICAADKIDLKMEFIDLRKEMDPELAARGLLLRSNEQKFNLENGPLLRLRLLQVGPNDYVFLMVMHHIITDGWSMTLIFKELLNQYWLHVQGLEDTRDALRIHYSDYAIWQQEQFQSNALQVSQAYWMDVFKMPVPVLDLPQDFARPPKKSFAGSHVFGQFDEILTDQVKTFSARHQVSLFTTLLAALKTLLYRYSSKEDMVVGSPIAGRVHPDLEDQLGFYVNTLPLRSQLKADMTFSELVNQVGRTVMDAHEHQGYPFDRIVDDLDLPKDLSRTPLFDVMFQVMNVDKVSASDMQGLKIDHYALEFPFSKFDLNVTAQENEGQLSLSFEFNTEVFLKARVDRMLGHFQNLIKRAVEGEGRSLESLMYLSDSEQLDLLQLSEGPNLDRTPPFVLHRFEKLVQIQPDNLALQFGSEHITYNDLSKRVNQVAEILIDRYDSGPGKVIGVMLDRSIECVVSMLAILKTSAIYLPLDKSLPETRLRYMLEDAQPSVVLTDEEWKSHPTFEKFQLFLLEDSDLQQGYSKSIFREPDPNGVSYIIYTSGSTGKPKGVLQTYKTLNNLIDWDLSHTGIEPAHSHLQFSSFYFDSSIHDVLHTLCGGGVVHILPDALRTDWSALEEYILEWEVEVLSFPFAAIDAFFQSIDKTKWARHKVNHLITTGEQPMINPDLKQFLLDNSSVTLHNFYGPSETHVVTASRVKGASNLVVRPSAGRPLQGTYTYILDEHLQLQPIGIPGELYVGGENLGVGYLNLPEIDEARFVEDPFRPGNLMYKTGDICRWMNDGNIEYLGREDDQVKIRGYRVELGEVSQQMRHFQQVNQAIVLFHKLKGGDKVLTGYYSGEAQEEALKLHLKTHLPDYMVPVYLFKLEKFPITANGKIDKSALAIPEFERNEHYEAPGNELQRKLVAIWEVVLSHRLIGITDDFFELGGHSLKATRMMSLISKELGIRVGLETIFENPNIAELSVSLAHAEESPFKPITKAPTQPHYPLSHAQKRLWLLSQFEENQTTYNMPSAYVLKGQLDVGRLETSFRTLVARHSALRSAITMIDDEPRQKVIDTDQLKFSLVQHDLGAKINPQEALDEILTDLAQHVFELSQAPLIKVDLIRIRKEEHVLMLNIHHVISDGWSMGIFANELLTLYNSENSAAADALPSLLIQYVDYALWQETHLHPEYIQHLVKYWKNRLGTSYPLLKLPFDFDRPEVRTSKGDNHHSVIPDNLSEKLKAFSNRKGVPVYHLLFATYSRLLGLISGQQDLFIGTSVAGREHFNLENIIGFFVNTLAIKVTNQSNESFAEFLSRFGKDILQDLKHQDLQFDQLIQHLPVERTTGSTPIFQVRFNYHNYEMEHQSTSKHDSDYLKVERLPIETDWTKFDLSLSIAPSTDDYFMIFEYSTDLFKAQTIETLAEDYLTLLEWVLDHPDVSEFTGSLKLAPEKRASHLRGKAGAMAFMKSISAK